MLIYNIMYMCSAVGIAGNEQLETIHLVSTWKSGVGPKLLSWAHKNEPVCYS